jgi:hypothetical protein
MRKTLSSVMGLLTLLAAGIAQGGKTADVAAVAQAGSASGGRYTNSYFHLTVEASGGTLQLNPLVNAEGRRARLLQVLQSANNSDDKFTLGVTADSLQNFPATLSPAQYVRSVRHQFERSGMKTVHDEFPMEIGGITLTGAILEVQDAGSMKHYRGMFSTLRNGYVLSFDVEAASAAKVTDVMERVVKFSG